MARGPMAGVSGPGKFSKRTDGMSFESTEYGSGVELTPLIYTGGPLARPQMYVQHLLVRWVWLQVKWNQ
jgi:hypothetical protein